MWGGPGKVGLDTHLLLLLVEVVNDDADEEVEGEEGPEDDEDDEIEVHVEVHFVLWLLLLLQDGTGCSGWAWEHMLAAPCSLSHCGQERSGTQRWTHPPPPESQGL